MTYVYVSGQGSFVSMFWGLKLLCICGIGGHSSYVIMFSLECICDFGLEILYLD
jgi:hypothetical protein